MISSGKTSSSFILYCFAEVLGLPFSNYKKQFLIVLDLFPLTSLDVIEQTIRMSSLALVKTR